MNSWMLECDRPGCGTRYNNSRQEELRGTGRRGLKTARRWAALEGWVSFQSFNVDLCPQHVPVVSPREGTQQ